jgi:hypothetical protein
MKTPLSVVLFLLFCIPVRGEDIPADLVEQAVKVRKEKISGLEVFIERQKKGIRDLKSGAIRTSGNQKDAIRDAQQKLADNEKTLQDLKNEEARSTLGKPGPRSPLRKVVEYTEVKKHLPEFNDPGDLRVGAVGGFGERFGPTVIYIKNGEELVFRWNGVTAIRGIKTAGLVDGHRIKLPSVVKVTGTTRYGGSTIFVIEPYTIPGMPTPEETRQAEAQLSEILKKRAEEKAKADAKAAADNETKAAAKAQQAEKDKLIQAEKDAARKLKLAKGFLEGASKNKEAARQRLKEIVEKYPDTKAAKEATELLEKLDR